MDDYGVGSSGNSGTQSGNQGTGSDGSSGSSGSSGQSNYGSSGSQTTQGVDKAQTTAYPSAHTSTASPTTTSQSQTDSAFPTSTSSSSGISSSERSAIIAGVLGGVAALLIISLIAIYCLQKRKAEKAAGRKGVTQQVSYNELNSSFAGVPFIKRNSRASDSEISRPPMVADTSYQGADMRGGQSSWADLSSDMETDRFLPSYEETQQRTAAANGHGWHRAEVNGTVYVERGSGADHDVSPATARDPFTDQSRLSQLSQNTTSPTRPGPLIRHDTMGFPLDDDDTSYIGPDGEAHRLSMIVPSPRTSILGPSIISPAPIRPTVSHENLERGIQGNQDLDQNRPLPQHLDSLTSNYDNPYESENENENENDTVPPMNRSYGGEQTMSPVPMQSSTWLAARKPHLAASFAGNIHRNMSTRTESSFAPSVVSDTELDRLGVGNRGK